MTVRFYSSVAAETTLVGTINAAATVIQLASVTGLPATTPYTLALDYESSTEELVQVDMAAGTTLTVTRAIDGTSAAGHNAGARVRHTSSARDFSDSRTHENSDDGVHGLAPGEELVGTDKVQTLSNKTLNMAEGTLNRIDIFNNGGWVTTVNGDVAFPTTSLMQWKPTGAATEVATVNSLGAFVARNKNAGEDALATNYRLRATKTDGTTDIFYVISGGQVVTRLSNSGQGFTLRPENDNADQLTRAFQTLDAAGVVVRSGVYTSGGAFFRNNAPAGSALQVRAAAAQSASTVDVQNSSAATMWNIQGNGKMDARGVADVRNVVGAAGDPVLRVMGKQPGQTGDLLQLVDAGNVIQAWITSAGDLRVKTIGTAVNNIPYRPMQTGTATTTFTADLSQSVAVVFPIAFASTPIVTISKSNGPGGSAPIAVSAINATPTGFTAFFNTVDSAPASATGLTAAWHAAGPA